MSERSLEAVRRWREFASALQVSWVGKHRSWADHISGNGYADESKLVQPVAFPAFAEDLLGFSHLDLAAEDSAGVDDKSKPDFTPADTVTHKFVFETKGTAEKVKLSGHDTQVKHYLVQGKSRIRWVVVTNLVGLRVFTLNVSGHLEEAYAINLKALLAGTEAEAAASADAERLADFFDQFSKQVLTAAEKLDRVKAAPPWNPVVEVTTSSWILSRMDKTVQILIADVEAAVKAQVLTNPAVVDADTAAAILDEMRSLAARLGLATPETVTLAKFLAAKDGTDMAKAVEQFCAHTAYFTATRLLLVRVWEDLGLLEPMLYDGGFRDQMARFDDMVADVVSASFNKAKTRYKSLFERNNNYTWFQPTEASYIDVIYEIANTYLGDIRSDVLGEVYERMLDRIDRKLLGQYYTPRDIIGLIWDLIDLDTVAQTTEAQGREPRVLDIATGSGGFLVEAAARLRTRVAGLRAQGASIDQQQWVNTLAEGLNGVERQRFSAYLAELNLLVQFGQAVSAGGDVAIPPLGILNADTLSLYEPTTEFPAPTPATISRERTQLAGKISAAVANDNLMDIVCGNPPYIGEKLAAPLIARTRAEYPYWGQFVAAHPDYLYNFLILGVSKLRAGGRFGFITTEYWLRAEGAAPLRDYLARRCQIDRIVLFRDLRLFPDAMGQHSLVITGTRTVGPDDTLNDGDWAAPTKPVVSIYTGPSIPDPGGRADILEAVKDAKTTRTVRTFTARVSPNTLRRGSWFEVTLTQSELARRRALTDLPQVPVMVSKGVETTVNGLPKTQVDKAPADVARAVRAGGALPGIQLLKAREVEDLGPLNAAEKKTLRQVINTKDVYPYAVILPADATSVIYLAKPDGIPSDQDPDTTRTMAFPAGLPALQGHMEQYRSVLLDATRQRGENRPWWTLHRPRADVLGQPVTTGTWDNFAVTARWGAGQRLIVGLAPAGTSPASGLHVLRPSDPAISAAYLSAIYNSAAYQAVAASLPPGAFRKEDLLALGLPTMPGDTTDLERLATNAAAAVTKMIGAHQAAFPLLGDTLRNDVALATPPASTWTHSYAGSLAKGPLSAVAWVTDIEKHGSLAVSIDRVSTSTDARGALIDVWAKKDNRKAMTVRVDHASLDAVPALAALMRGAFAAGRKLDQLPDLEVPVAAQVLSRDWLSAVEDLMADVNVYHKCRADIEDVISRHV